MSAGDRDDFLSRWSRRKVASRAGPDRPTADAIPASAGAQSPNMTGPAPAGTESSVKASETEPRPPAPLPPAESLTPESDFTPFMRSDVDPGVRRQALRTLFRDPRFNVMDGLDVYIDDYSKPDPLPADWLGKLNQMARLGDYRPPQGEDKDKEKEKDEPVDGAAEHAAAEEIPILAEGNSGAAPIPTTIPASDTSAAGSPTPESSQS